MKKRKSDAYAYITYSNFRRMNYLFLVSLENESRVHVNFHLVEARKVEGVALEVGSIHLLVRGWCRRFFHERRVNVKIEWNETSVMMVHFYDVS